MSDRVLLVLFCCDVHSHNQSCVYVFCLGVFQGAVTITECIARIRQFTEQLPLYAPPILDMGANVLASYQDHYQSIYRSKCLCVFRLDFLRTYLSVFTLNSLPSSCLPSLYLSPLSLPFSLSLSLSLSLVRQSSPTTLATIKFARSPPAAGNQL